MDCKIIIIIVSLIAFSSNSDAIGSYNFIMIRYALFFLIIFNISHAVEFQGDFKQGSFILGKTDPGTKVTIDKKRVKVSDDGYFVFGLGRDRKNNIIIKTK